MATKSTTLFHSHDGASKAFERLWTNALCQAARSLVLIGRAWACLTSLVEVVDLDIDATVKTRDRPEISDMAVPANPHGQSLRERTPGSYLQPIVELYGIAAHISMRGARHLGIAPFGEDR